MDGVSKEDDGQDSNQVHDFLGLRSNQAASSIIARAGSSVVIAQEVLQSVL